MYSQLQMYFCQPLPFSVWLSCTERTAAFMVAPGKIPQHNLSKPNFTVCAKKLIYYE